MSNQLELLIKALKKQLKVRALNYQDVAIHLDVSEVTVKRMFSEKKISLERLEQICSLLDMTFFELAKHTVNTNSQQTILTLHQEQLLANTPLLLVYFYLILNGWSAARIQKYYKISKIEAIKVLTKLDKMKLIELLPSNRVKLLTGRQINWLPHGPVRKLHETHAKREFLKAGFSNKKESFQFLFGELSNASIEILTRKLVKFNKEFNELVDIDMHLPPEEKSSIGLLTATRPWIFSLVEQFKFS